MSKSRPLLDKIRAGEDVGELSWHEIAHDLIELYDERDALRSVAENVVERLEIIDKGDKGARSGLGIKRTLSDAKTVLKGSGPSQLTIVTKALRKLVDELQCYIKEDQKPPWSSLGVGVVKAFVAARNAVSGGFTFPVVIPVANPIPVGVKKKKP